MPWKINKIERVTPRGVDPYTTEGDENGNPIIPREVEPRNVRAEGGIKTCDAEIGIGVEGTRKRPNRRFYSGNEEADRLLIEAGSDKFGNDKKK